MTEQEDCTPSPALEVSLRVPERLDEALDPAWLAAALSGLGGGSPVRSVRLAEHIRTVASKARIELVFEAEPVRVHRLCLKAFLDLDDPAAGGATTIAEGDFYGRIAPRLTMRLPRCPAIVVDRANSRGILVMEDLVAAGARFCDARDLFDAATVERTLDQLARLHAASALLPELPWVPNRFARVAARPHLDTPTLQALMDDPRGATLDARTRDAALLLEGMRALAARVAGRPETLLHGDCHPGNVYVTPDGPAFTDWQLIQRGPWALDVAYHVASVMRVEDAERHERALLEGYLDALASHGGPRLDREEAWMQYREAVIYGYYQWAITRFVKPELIVLSCERLGAAVARHESYRLLGL